MRNDATCKVIEIETVKIKTDDVIKTLKNIRYRYVLDLIQSGDCYL